jgi:hypothetical protein
MMMQDALPGIKRFFAITRFNGGVNPPRPWASCFQIEFLAVSPNGRLTSDTDPTLEAGD